jgi:hypothetical protein
MVLVTAAGVGIGIKETGRRSWMTAKKIRTGAG